jgi:hypothetical protein
MRRINKCRLNYFFTKNAACYTGPRGNYNLFLFHFCHFRFPTTDTTVECIPDEDATDKTPASASLLDKGISESTDKVTARANELIDRISSELKCYRESLEAATVALQTRQNKLKRAETLLTFESIEDDDELVNHLTGLPNAIIFETLLKLFNRFNIWYYMGWAVETPSRREQLFITLRKLRTNVSMKTLAWDYRT